MTVFAAELTGDGQHQHIRSYVAHEKPRGDVSKQGLITTARQPRSPGDARNHYSSIQNPRATCLNQVREQQTHRLPQRQSAGGVCCRGRDELQRRAAANCRAWQVLAQAGPYGASTGLGGLRLGWGFS